MLSQYTVESQAAAAARYTADADVDVLIGNPDPGSRIYWTVTPDDTAPTIAPRMWNSVAPDSGQSLSLKTGDRLWLAKGRGGAGQATLEVLTA
jgi:hypothetical protein